MIDRKALRISVLLILAMIAATLWCLSLLPDWSHFPLNGPGDATSRPSIWLFVSPGCLLFVMAVLFARKWFATGSEDAVAPWRRWSWSTIRAWRRPRSAASVLRPPHAGRFRA